jgi:alpha-L-rhamnosidase
MHLQLKLKSILLILLAASFQVKAAEPLKIQVTQVDPVLVEKRGEVYFADFGKDAYGNLQVTVPMNASGTTLKVRLGEKLAADGTIDQKPGGSVNFVEAPLVLQAGKRVCEPEIPVKPRHKNPAAVRPAQGIGEITPFRYAEIEGATWTLDKSSLRQLFVHAPFDDNAAAFECSDPTLNAVWELCRHTMKATTAFGLYIDGERERIPYEADAYINQLSHYACDLDPRVARATVAHLLAHPTWPTEWSLHMPMMAAADYEATGDPVLAKTHFDELKKKLLMGKANGDGLLRAGGIVDWPEGERDGYNDGRRAFDHGQQVGPDVNTAVNAFYFHALEKMALLAGAVGRSDDARDLASKAQKVHDAFNAKFFDATRGIYIDGEGSRHASLHANMFALAFGLVPDERKAAVAEFVQSRGMACSVYGAQYLLEALFNAGREDCGVQLMTSKGERSWWHMIELGSTMTTEAWDAKFKGNLTWNHAWGSAPANIISRFVLGVRPLEPGYAKILIAPQPGALEWARGKVPTPHGPVMVNVKTTGVFHLEVAIPPRTQGRIQLSEARLGDAASRKKVILDGKAVQVKIEGGKYTTADLASGHHTLEVR